eukprot:6201300-Prymnesium_polylepis.2
MGWRLARWGGGSHDGAEARSLVRASCARSAGGRRAREGAHAQRGAQPRVAGERTHSAGPTPERTHRPRAHKRTCCTTHTHTLQRHAQPAPHARPRTRA